MESLVQSLDAEKVGGWPLGGDGAAMLASSVGGALPDVTGLGVGLMLHERACQDVRSFVMRVRATMP
jgi:hypothetical protein